MCRSLERYQPEFRNPIKHQEPSADARRRRRLKLQLLCPPQQLGSTAFLTAGHFCVFLSQFFTAVLQLLKVYIRVHVE
jgi:hypothetical protein